MRANYLLHNETAKKLYFEYAKDLPIITLCSKNKANEDIYNNIAEAFLFNDFYKLNAMRDCGVDEKYITGDASDYEKFKAFCTVLPQLAGNPIYLNSHIELNTYFDCRLEINSRNADAIWETVNHKIQSEELSERKLIDKTDIRLYRLFDYDYPIELERKDINDWISLEKDLIMKMNSEDKQGCRLAAMDTAHEFIRPNPYLVNQIVNKFSNGKKLSPDESTVLDIQVKRTLCKEAKSLNWTILIPAYAKMNTDVISYLKSNDILPNIIPCFTFEADDGITDIESALRTYCRNYPIGKSVLTLYIRDQRLSYAQCDYFRRALCTVIGKWVEDGEYTGDENTLKKLIQDILYNNLKEAIG